MDNSAGKTALGLDKNIGGLLCYLPICAISLIYSIIVLVTDKDNRDMRFHAFQSLLLTGGYIVLLVGINIVSVILTAAVSEILGALMGLVSLALILGFLVLMIIGCIKAFQGQMWKAPIVGNMAENWAG
ncbi:MAG: DUF4870 domain-containing protein [Pyrinomonadaceae bacterium]